jgi:hypothetical protein
MLHSKADKNELNFQHASGSSLIIQKEQIIFVPPLIYLLEHTFAVCWAFASLGLEEC